MSNLAFSIIIPVYNVELYLEECLNSLINQTFNDFEVICINDGSTDRSGDILKKYSEKDNRFKIINQENKGQSAARNTGLIEAKGEYVVFIDSDDWVENNLLESIYKIIEFKKYELIGINNLRVKEGVKANHEFNHLKNGEYTGIEYLERYISSKKYAPAAVWLFVFKNELFKNHALKFIDGYIHEDELFIPQALFYAKNVYISNLFLYNYRIREGATTNKSNIRKINDKFSISRLLIQFFKHHNYSSKLIYTNIKNLYLSAIRESIAIHEEKFAQKLLLKEDYRFLIKNSVSLKEKLFYYLIKIDIRLFGTLLKIIDVKRKIKNVFSNNTSLQ